MRMCVCVCVWREEGGERVREECIVNWRAKDREIEEVSVWVSEWMSVCVCVCVYVCMCVSVCVCASAN